MTTSLSRFISICYCLLYQSCFVCSGFTATKIPFVNSGNSTVHHVALKTRDINNAAKFYSLFGFHMDCKFRAGQARAAWLKRGLTRIEVIEVPSYMLQEEEGKIKRAPNLMTYQSLLGWNHIALDVTESVKSLENEASNTTGLQKFIEKVNNTSFESFGKSVRVALHPVQQIIGNSVYELAFLYDADGSLLELLNYQTDLKQKIVSPWDRWDGEWIAGASTSDNITNTTSIGSK